MVFKGKRTWSLLGPRKAMTAGKAAKKTKNVYVQLLEPMLSIYNPMPAVVRGSIVVQFDVAVVVKRLSITFAGHLLFYDDERGNHHDHHHFGHQHQHLYDQDGGTQLVLPPGTHTFTFDMPLKASSTLPSTVAGPQMRVAYDLQAGLEYQWVNDQKTMVQCASQAVHLVQLPSYDDFWIDNMMATIDSQKQSTEWCSFHVLVDRRMAPIGVPLHVHVSMAPHCERLKVAKVVVELTQRCMYASKITYRKLRLPCKGQTRSYLSSVHQGGIPWDCDFQFDWPSEGNELHADPTMENDENDKKKQIAPSSWLIPSFKDPNGPVHVEHALMIHVVINFPEQSGKFIQRTRRMLTFECPFDLLHAIGHDNLLTILPSSPTSIAIL
ncbi:hypothetical protein BC940DRAFT_307728 [Gongronella butleri]|nr:hypothetical protein BC940DRAFT_307728 [Gongronella butleri]